MPISRSVRRIATIVMINGKNWVQPSLYIAMNFEGWASLYPTTNRIAARLASGMRFKTSGIANTHTIKNTP